MTSSSNSAAMKASSWDWAELGAGTGLDAPENQEVQRERREREVKEAYRRGLGEGEAKGSAGARRELSSALSATLEALELVRANRAAWAAQLPRDLVLLSAAMSRVIVERALDEDPTIFVDLAKRAVASLPADETVRIRLHPADLERLTSSDSIDEVVGRRVVRWIPDDEVVRGGCIAEGPDQIADGRVDEVLRRLVQRMTDG